MKKKLLLLLAIATIGHQVANADEQVDHIRKYMKIVYPTSTEIQDMNDQQI